MKNGKRAERNFALSDWKGEKMVKTKGYSNEEEVKTLRDCVEFYALSICEDMEKGEGIERTLQRCKILNSLVGALATIGSQKD